MSHMSPCAWIPACVPQCMSSHSNRRPYITRTGREEGGAPNTYAWWKQLFTIRQLFTFPAYWMSSGGYRSFAECIISRWTSRLALILGNGRNVESTVETHISMKQLLSLLKNWACVDIYCRVPSVCVSPCLHAHTSINTYCMWVLHTGGYVISMNLSVY